MYEVMVEYGVHLVWLLPLMSAIVFHELAQGHLARYFGDKTAGTLHRLGMNPLKHIDGIGTLLVPIASWMLFRVAFGWARRIPISKKMLRHPEDMLLIALVGILSNLVQAMLWMTMHHYLILSQWLAPWWVMDVLQYGIQMNIAFAVINCLPIPPLDGHHIVDWLMPKRFTAFYRKLGKLGLLIIAGLMFCGSLTVIGAVIVPEIISWLDYALKQWVWY